MQKWISVSRRILKLAFILLVLAWFLARSDIEPGDQSEQVRAFTRHLEFDFVTWTWDALWIKGEQVSLGAVDYVPADDQPQIVLDYIALIREIFQTEWQLADIYADPNILNPDLESQALRMRIDQLHRDRNQLAPLAESVLQNQVSTIIADLGLALGGQPIPPVLYHVTPLPLALIVSPRHTIRQDADISLMPDITIAQRSDIEDQVDAALDVSSLVVNVGGIGLYPTMIMETTDINWLAEVVSHEWVHNFLTLRPLGASYLTSPELRVINETTASVADMEIGAALIARYYPEFAPPPPPPVSETDANKEDAKTEDLAPPPFDFRVEMHETRLTVDEMLAAGQIEEAETYMENRRRVFWENGYHIRKLNQAYFAFYGAYVDRPGGSSGASGASEDPIGNAVRTLRAESDSLAAFLNRISWMWRWDQLQAAADSK